MNAFQLIDEIGKLGKEWDITSWCKSVRLLREDGRSYCPLQVYVGGDKNFKETVGELLRRGVSIETIRMVQRAYDGYLHRDDEQAMKYRDYMLRSWKFTPAARELLKKKWKD